MVPERLEPFVPLMLGTPPASRAGSWLKTSPLGDGSSGALRHRGTRVWSVKGSALRQAPHIVGDQAARSAPPACPIATLDGDGAPFGGAVAFARSSPRDLLRCPSHGSDSIGRRDLRGHRRLNRNAYLCIAGLNRGKPTGPRIGLLQRRQLKSSATNHQVTVSRQIRRVPDAGRHRAWLRPPRRLHGVRPPGAARAPGRGRWRRSAGSHRKGR